MNIGKAFKDIKSYSQSPGIIIDCFAERVLHGFGVEQYIVLDFASKSKHCRRNYITRFDSKRMVQHLNYEKTTQEDRWNLDHKQLFNKFYADFVNRDWLFTGDSNEKEINDFIECHSVVLAKPIISTQGKNIRKINKLSDLTDDERVSGQYLLEEIIVQHHALAELNQDSVNTVRVYTLKDRNEEVHVLATVLRVGTPGHCVDNFHAGGTAWPLEIQNGIVVAKGFSATGTIDSYYLPGKDIFMMGFKVPNWPDVINTVTKAAERTPLRWLGWDVAVKENGVALVEANNGADVDLVQFLCGKKDEINQILSGELHF